MYQVLTDLVDSLEHLRLRAFAPPVALLRPALALRKFILLAALETVRLTILVTLLEPVRIRVRKTPVTDSVGSCPRTRRSATPAGAAFLLH